MHLGDAEDAEDAGTVAHAELGVGFGVEATLGVQGSAFYKERTHCLILGQVGTFLSRTMKVFNHGAIQPPQSKVLAAVARKGISRQLMKALESLIREFHGLDSVLRGQVQAFAK